MQKEPGNGDVVGWAPSAAGNHTDWSICCRLSSENRIRKIQKKKRRKRKKGGGRLLDIQGSRKLRAEKCILASETEGRHDF